MAYGLGSTGWGAERHLGLGLARLVWDVGNLATQFRGHSFSTPCNPTVVYTLNPKPYTLDPEAKDPILI